MNKSELDSEKSVSFADFYARMEYWTEMAIASAPLSSILKSVGLDDENLTDEEKADIQTSIEYLKLANAYNLTKEATLSYKYAWKAYDIIEDLVKLRSEQDKADYNLLLAPFYYKLGDNLATVVKLHTDESGNLLPLPDEFSSQDVEDDDQEESVQESDPSDEQQNDGECLLNTAFDYFQAALQKIKDATGGKDSVFKNELLFLQIQICLRMAELGEHLGDLDSLSTDFLALVKLCEQQSEKNGGTLTSAIFALGKIYLEKQDQSKAKQWFTRAHDHQFCNKKQELDQAFKKIETDHILEDLQIESKFVSDQIKETKLSAKLILFYLDLVQKEIEKKHLLYQLKEKKKETLVRGDGEEAFSKAPANSFEFTTFALKKRPIAEVTPTSLPNQTDCKRRKI